MLTPSNNVYYKKQVLENLSNFKFEEDSFEFAFKIHEDRKISYFPYLTF